MGFGLWTTLYISYRHLGVRRHIQLPTIIKADLLIQNKKLNRRMHAHILAHLKHYIYDNEGFGSPPLRSFVPALWVPAGLNNTLTSLSRKPAIIEQIASHTDDVQRLKMPKYRRTVYF